MNCPYCAKEIQDGSIACVYCGRAVLSDKSPLDPERVTGVAPDLVTKTNLGPDENIFNTNWTLHQIPNEQNRYLLQLSIHLPDECAWCASKSVTGKRTTWLYNGKNPYFKGTGAKVAAKAVNAAALLTLGGLGSALVKIDTPETSNLENYLIAIELPHCEQHADSTEKIIEWVDFVTEFQGKIRILNSQLVASVKSLIAADIKTAAQNAIYFTGKFNFASMEDLQWPDRCIVCGELHPPSKYFVELTNPPEPGAKTEVPICAKDKVNQDKSSSTLVSSLGICSIIGVAFGIASFWLIKVDTFTHVLCCIGSPILLFGIGYAISALYNRIFLSKGVAAYQPIQVVYDKNKNLYSFQMNTINTEIGKSYFHEMVALNQDKIRQVDQ